jgi:hypothetical protein
MQRLKIDKGHEIHTHVVALNETNCGLKQVGTPPSPPHTYW